MRDILLTSAFIGFCFLCLLLFYRRLYWRDRRARAVFGWTLGVLAVVLAAKYVIGHVATGYIAGRTLFYARPSPRIDGLYFLAAIGAALWALAEWYRRRHRWAPWIRLSLLWLIFVVFAAGIAGLRDGVAGIAEPFTRTDWEFVADTRLISSIPQFLGDYVASYPALSMHGKTHPPGNALVLHVLQWLFRVDIFGLALLVLVVGGTLVFPVYFFWRRYLPEAELEAVMPIFMLTPAVVMFAATSMDIVALPFFWVALLICDLGWRRGAVLSFAGGIVAALGLLLSFQFLVFGVIMLFFFVRQLGPAERGSSAQLLVRGAASAAGFALFLVSLELFADYSILDNYRAAHAYHYSMVAVGALSIGTQLLFALSNLTAFLLLLGVVHSVLVLRQSGSSGSAQRDLVMAGPVFIGLLVLSGVYQGEAERLWLFLTPLFIPAMLRGLRSAALPHGAALSLLAFQIVATQVLFYTYW